MTAMVTNQGGILGISTVVRVRRSMLKLRRIQVVSMDHGHELELDELDLFQTHVAARFASLLPAAGGTELISLPFLEKLLEAFLLCEEEFRALLVLVIARDPAVISKPPMDRLVSDLLDRAVKALDICNAVTDAIGCLRHCLGHADIAASAVRQHPRSSQRPPCMGQLLRAKKSLNSFLGSMPTDPHDQEGSGKSERTWSSLGRRHNSGSSNRIGRSKSERHLRALSSSLSRKWSASKQLHAMAAGLGLTRGADTIGGLVLAMHTMSSVLVFTMWALVAALPCQDRGTAPATWPVVAPPSNKLAWTAPLAALQERISEEWKKREKKGSGGLLMELQTMESRARGLLEKVAAGGGGGCAENAEELAEACRKLGMGMGPLEKQVREVFHRVVRSREEVQQLLEQSSRSTTSAASFDPSKVQRKQHYYS